MTIVTPTSVREGTEPEWDAAMRDRLDAARSQPSLGRSHLLIPLHAANKRVRIGTWETCAAWEAWHNDAACIETRMRLEGLEATPNQQWWHEVILDVQPEAGHAWRLLPRRGTRTTKESSTRRLRRKKWPSGTSYLVQGVRDGVWAVRHRP